MRGSARSPRSGGILALLGLRREGPVSGYSEAMASISTPPVSSASPPPVRYRSPGPNGRPSVDLSRPAVAPVSPTPPIPRLSGAAVGPECSNCRLPTLASQEPGRFSCPLCGRHYGSPIATSPSPARPPTASTAAPRVSEELLAAWVSGTKLPCPSCKSPMRHAGPGEFVCRACGKRRTIPGFPPPRGDGAAPAAAAPVPAA